MILSRVLVLLGLGGHAHAGVEWDTLCQEAESLYQQGYARATVVAKKALQVAEHALGPDHPDVARSLNELAELYRVQGQYAQAESLAKRASDLGKGAWTSSSHRGHKPEQPGGVIR